MDDGARQIIDRDADDDRCWRGKMKRKTLKQRRYHNAAVFYHT
ncbi:hypothetical protein KKH3_22200 [Pectobacterium actinidiae]|nr:hypothetical protein KKH3_22200 [Pectobacterium actinidiae]